MKQTETFKLYFLFNSNVFPSKTILHTVTLIKFSPLFTKQSVSWVIDLNHQATLYMYNVNFNNNLIRLVSLAKPMHQFTKFSVHILKNTNKKITFLNIHTEGGVLPSKTVLLIIIIIIIIIITIIIIIINNLYRGGSHHIMWFSGRSPTKIKQY